MKKVRQTTSTETAALESLEQLEAQFNHWRHNKSYSRETIPLDLLQAARALSDHLGHTCVKSRLGISGAQLKRGELSEETIKPALVRPSPTSQQQFVKTTVNNTTTAHAWRIELHSPTGAVITVSGMKNNPIEIINQLLEEAAHDCA
jgi:hypothetical protein